MQNKNNYFQKKKSNGKMPPSKRTKTSLLVLAETEKCRSEWATTTKNSWARWWTSWLIISFNDKIKNELQKKKMWNSLPWFQIKISKYAIFWFFLFILDNREVGEGNNCTSLTGSYSRSGKQFWKRLKELDNLLIGGRTGTFPRHIQARSKFSARERKKGARDKRREQKRLSGRNS